MIHALHAEWTKLRTLPAVPWLLLAVAALTAAASLAAVVPVEVAQCPSPAECFEDTTRLSLTGVKLGQVAAVVLAVLAIGNEYGTGMIRTTLAAVPRRRNVLLAKAIVVAVPVLAAGALGVLGSVAAGRAVLPGNGFTPAHGYPALSLTDGPTLRAAAGSVIYLVLIALLALGVTVAVRDTAGSLTAVMALLFFAPVLVQFLGDEHWRERLEKVSPMPAGLAVQATERLDDLPIGPWPGLGVLAAWSAAALLAGAVALAVRDA